MKVLLVARDIGGCQGLDALGKELSARGHDVFSHLGFGEPLGKKEGVGPGEIFVDAQVRDAVFVGRSSTPELSKPELAAIRGARSVGKPYGIYTDNYNTIVPWFEEMAKEASLIFVINEELAARDQMLFPKVRVVATGNPMWEQFCFPNLTRAVARIIPRFSADDIVILATGCKTAAVNRSLWAGAINGISRAIGIKPNLARQLRLIVSSHGGDENDPKVYQELLALCPVPVYFNWQRSTKIKSSDLLPAADLVIDLTSSIGIEAAHQRIPVINYFSEVVGAWLERARGNRTWESCGLGAMKAVFTVNEITDAILDLTVTGAYDEMRTRQEEVYPASPVVGNAAKKMADAVETLLS